MFSEKKFSLANEGEPKIIIKRSTDAPPDVKQNPFYDSEFWGRANSPDDIYLPDSDEAISFAMAAHEIGHLVKAGERDDTGLDNFEATRAEEQRAWDKGWEYLQKYLDEYFEDRPELVPGIRQIYERVRDLAMEAVDLSEAMYLEAGALDDLSSDEIDEIIQRAGFQ